MKNKTTEMDLWTRAIENALPFADSVVERWRDAITAHTKADRAYKRHKTRSNRMIRDAQHENLVDFESAYPAVNPESPSAVVAIAINRARKEVENQRPIAGGYSLGTRLRQWWKSSFSKDTRTIIVAVVIALTFTTFLQFIATL